MDEKQLIDDAFQDILEMLNRCKNAPTMPDIKRCAMKIFYDIAFQFKKNNSESNNG